MAKEPTFVSVPSKITLGTQFTITWANASGINQTALRVRYNGSSTMSDPIGVYNPGVNSHTMTISNSAYTSIQFVLSSNWFNDATQQTESSNYVNSAWITIASADTPPTTPGTISISPNPPIRGQNATITWGASSVSVGTLTGYTLQRQYNGGAWTQVQSSASRSFSETINTAWNSVAYRVMASGSGGSSAWSTSSTYTTTENVQPPAISGSNADLGTKSAGFSQSYTITHPQSKTTTVAERIDGVLVRSYTATLGTAQSFDVTGMVFMTLLNGVRTMTITATDTSGQSATRTYTFTKSVTAAKIMLDTPLPADDIITKCILNVQREIPAGATFKVEVCNNGNDAAPTWEDATSAVVQGRKFFFTNTAKTAADWGFNFRIMADRGSAAGPAHIISIGGNFE